MDWIKTKDICSNDIIQYNEKVYKGVYPNSKIIGERNIVALVIKESYGVKKQQHTFKLCVIESKGIEPLKPQTIIYRKGRKIYNNCYRQKWSYENYRKKVLKEKHDRGQKARLERKLRNE